MWVEHNAKRKTCQGHESEEYSVSEESATPAFPKGQTGQPGTLCFSEAPIFPHTILY